MGSDGCAMHPGYLECAVAGWLAEATVRKEGRVLASSGKAYIATVGHPLCFLIRFNQSCR